MTRLVSIKADGREIEISKPDKVLFPKDGITKLDLAEYYARIAKTALPHYVDRPLTMQRFPDGITTDGFFQKNVPDHFPDWIPRVELPKKDGTVNHTVVNKAATLVYLADQGCITPHLALAHADTPYRPDRMIFDLDPSDDDFSKVQEVAHALKEALDKFNLPSFVTTTGSRGMHIVLALDASEHVDDLRPFARCIATLVAQQHPTLATTEQRKNKRGERVLIDTFRTAYAQTAVAPYAVRARHGAPIATPLQWDEAFSSGLSAERYDTTSIFRRLGQIDDPWADLGAHPIAANRLVALVDAIENET